MKLARQAATSAAWWALAFLGLVLFFPRPAEPMTLPPQSIHFDAFYWGRNEVRVVASGAGGAMAVRWWSYQAADADGGHPWTLVGTYNSTAPDGEGWLPVVRDVPMVAYARVYDLNSRNELGEPKEIGAGGVVFVYDGQVHKRPVSSAEKGAR